MSRASKPDLPVESVAQGRYVLERVLGVGGMATVYRAHDVRLDLPRAVKILNPDLVSSPSLRKRFEIEARTMAKLHHPNIVAVYDIGTENELAYMVMELLEGGSLNDRLKNVGYLLPRTALAAGISILSALVLAHGKGVIHRDIKPHNVLVALDGIPKLTDFGIAHIIGQDKALTATNAVIGTWAFMAPEQRKSARRVTVHSDIYAVGATLYALLTARDPFDIYNKELQRELFAGIPEPIVEVIERATRYWPDERYGSAAEMLAAIQRADNLLRPEYLDEPSRLAPMVDLSEPSPSGPVGEGPAYNSGESTFDDIILSDAPTTPSLSPGELPRGANPTLAAPGEDEPPTAPEEPLDPFVDEATPIHMWQASTDPLGSRRFNDMPSEILTPPARTPPAGTPAPSGGLEPVQAPSHTPPPTTPAQVIGEPASVHALGGSWALGGLLIALLLALLLLWGLRSGEGEPTAPGSAPTPQAPGLPVQVTAPATQATPAAPSEPVAAPPAQTAPEQPTGAPQEPAVKATPPTPASTRPRVVPTSKAEEQRRLEALPGQ